MKQQFIFLPLIIGLLLSLPNSLLAKSPIEVAHWWTSGGESKAVNVLKEALKQKGYEWKDFVIAGGGGGDHRNVLQARVASGNPPSAVVTFVGPNIWKLGEEMGLANLNAIAEEGKWSEILPPLIDKMIQYDGNYVAVPVNAHRSNWMWANASIFQTLNLEVPKTWDDFFVVADAIQKVGIIPLALGGQPWQEATLFESVLLGVGGVEFHKQTMIDLDIEQISSPKMVEVFETMKKLKKYTDKDAPGRAWDKATDMVLQGEAAMQIMGDWAKGEFLLQNKKPMVDFLCQPAPGNQGIFVIDVDAFAMFNVDEVGDSAKEAQNALARTLLEPDVQEKFNLVKGSIPSHLGVSGENFDLCARQSMQSIRKDQVVPSFAFVQANPPEVHKAMVEVISTFFNSDMPPQDAANNMASTVLMSL